jgi:hypothetical protein
MFTSVSARIASHRVTSRLLPNGAEAALQQLTMLITAEGKWVLPDSEEFLAALGDPNPDFDAVGFAVRNLGFIKFQVLDRVVTEIELHPRNVEPDALLALEQLLEEVGTNLYRIKYLDDEWHSEISASAEHTLGRLRELCTHVVEPEGSERFRAEPRDPAVLFDTKDGRATPLGHLAMKWRVSFGQYDRSLIPFAIENGFFDRLMIAEVNEDDEHPVFRLIGEGFSWLDSDYRKRAVGQALTTMPDKSYGEWLSGVYKAVAVSGKPRLDRVTASMQLLPGQKPDYRTCYERLLLPWRISPGKTLISLSARRLGPAEIAATGSESTGRASSPSKKDTKSS